RAAIAHLWFETIHPFEDGNGRVGRNIVDLVLSQAIGETSRLVPISQRLLTTRKDYCDELNLAQRGDCEAHRAISWFLDQVAEAFAQSARAVAEALQKARFWLVHKDLALNDRQRKAINRLIDAGPEGFEGGMSTRKYVALTGASPATATRDLGELE